MIKNGCCFIKDAAKIFVIQRSGTEHEVLIDLEDLERINELRDFSVHVKFDKGTNSFYAQFHDENHKTKRLHRLIMDTPKELVVDHINHNTLDNRKCNLRNVTTRENLSNQKRKSECSSQCVGVSWDKQKKKWKAHIAINGKKKHLGYFTNELQAAEAYLQAKIKSFKGGFPYHG